MKQKPTASMAISGEVGEHPQDAAPLTLLAMAALASVVPPAPAAPSAVTVPAAPLSVAPRVSLQCFSSFVFACVVFALINWSTVFLAGRSRTAAVNPGDGEDSAISRIRAVVTPVPIEKTFMAWTTRDWLNRRVAPDVVLMGSSQMASATFSGEAVYLNKTIDCVQHRDIEMLAGPLSAIAQRLVQVFNWSQSGAMASDDYLIASNLFKAPLVPSIIIIGVSPRDFIDNTLPCIGSTEAFQFFARRVNLNEYVQQAFPDFMSRLAWTIDSLPLQQLGQNFKIEMRDLTYARPAGDHSNRAGVREKSTEGLHPRSDFSLTPRPFKGRLEQMLALQMKYVVTPAAALRDGVLRDDDLTHVEPGKWFVPPVMPPYKDNTVEYRHRYSTVNAERYERQKGFFDKLLSTMHDRGTLVMVVGMPSQATNRELLPQSFWNQWRSNIAAGCGKYKDPWLDLSNSSMFVKDDYLDTVHLNANGGKKLMNAIFTVLATNPDMRARLVRRQNAVIADHNFQS